MFKERIQYRHWGDEQLTAVLVKAVQEQQKEIVELKREVVVLNLKGPRISRGFFEAVCA